MDFVDNALDTGSGTIRGRAVVDNPGNFLTPGMFGHMRLQGSGAYLALLIPDQAVVTDQTRQVVYVVAADGKVSERDIVPGPLTGGLRVIRQGLRPNDVIIIDGVQRARVGQKITPHQGKITPAPAASDAQTVDSVGEPAGSATIVDAGPAATPAR
jgi:RND family efflux transporter MFP subunit